MQPEVQKGPGQARQYLYDPILPMDTKDDLNQYNEKHAPPPDYIQVMLWMHVDEIKNLEETGNEELEREIYNRKDDGEVGARARRLLLEEDHKMKHFQTALVAIVAVTASMLIGICFC